MDMRKERGRRRYESDEEEHSRQGKGHRHERRDRGEGEVEADRRRGGRRSRSEDGSEDDRRHVRRSDDRERQKERKSKHKKKAKKYSSESSDNSNSDNSDVDNDYARDRRQTSRRSRSRSRSPPSSRRRRSYTRSRSQTRSRSPSPSSYRRREHRSRRDRHDDYDDDRYGRRRGRENDDYNDEEARQRLEEVKRREKELRKEEKRRMKMMETPEEKRARRLAKKELKAERKKAMLAHGGADFTADAEESGRFVWHKKVEAAQEKGLSREELARIERERAEENQREIEMIKKRRAQREQEQQERLREKDMLLRQSEDAQFGEWAGQEELFIMKQARLRSELRLQAGRAKPVDLLAKYIHTERDDPNIDQHEPYTIFDTMTLEACEDLKEDIAVYLRLEGHLPENRAFWEDIALICDYKLKELYRYKAIEDPNLSAAERRALETGINERVKANIMGIFENKTLSQLLELERQIKSKIKSKDTVDVGYWETLLRELKVQFAKARLRDRHKELLQHKLNVLYQQQTEQAAREVISGKEAVSQRPEPEQEEEEDIEEDLFADMAKEEAGDRSFSPVPEEVPLEEDDDGKLLDKYQAVDILPDEPWQAQLTALRKIVLMMIKAGRQGELHPNFCKNQMVRGLSSREREFFAKAAAAQEAEDDEEEETFTDELQLEAGGDYLWKDKYRPRKPRYFNRVFTGYDWNEYNRTHYDKQNPPPKMVQGYKFNIFYPDLLDKSQTPTFTVEKLKDEPGFCMIRFSAGAPYEDVAFKIVDNRWLHGRRSGYRCQFTHNNVFELYFRFRRQRYYR
eukprot:m.61715 g.61715  ORF g.61715 m.61715 type:complete len:801 (-) comp13355_c0_seq1:413-2815(-)